MELEAVKGLQGSWHATFGEWDGHSKLKTLCGTSISPNYRRFSSIKRVINCSKCREAMAVKAGCGDTGIKDE